MTNSEPHTTGQRVSSSWLADLKAAYERRATGGPWHVEITPHGVLIYGDPGTGEGGYVADCGTNGWDSQADARLIAAMRNALPQLLAAAEAIERVRALHVADEKPYELIWYGDDPCPTCHADGITTECGGHDTICCAACWQPHPEDSSIAGPVPYPCPTARALQGATDAD